MSDASDPAEHPRWRVALRIATALITIGSLAWALWLLNSAWPQLLAHGVEIRAWSMLSGVASAVASSWLFFLAFVALVRALRISNLPHPQLAHLYFTSQLLKHLPGRVWGLGYQWMAAGREGSLGGWVIANLGHMALATYFALWSAWVVLAFADGGLLIALAIAGGLVAYPIVWMLLSSPFLGRTFGVLPGRFGLLAQRVPALLAETPNATRLRVFLLLLAGWLFHYGSWALFGLSYPSFGAGGGMQLCAYYMLAWFVGYVSLVTPSGLGVRELVFVWLAKDFPPDAVALMAIVGRASLLVVDVILGLTFAAFAPKGAPSAPPSGD